MRPSVVTFASILSFSFILSACGMSTLTLSSFDASASVALKVEIADSPKERERGLMERTELQPDTGMLFVFTEPDILTFWMKNTGIPLEIIFFDAAGQFVNAVRMQPCEAEPCPQYTSAALSLYALEVTPGFREKHGIGVGWKLDLKEVQAMSRPT